MECRSCTKGKTFLKKRLGKITSFFIIRKNFFIIYFVGFSGFDYHELHVINVVVTKEGYTNLPEETAAAAAVEASLPRPVHSVEEKELKKWMRFCL